MQVAALFPWFAATRQSCWVICLLESVKTCTQQLCAHEQELLKNSNVSSTQWPLSELVSPTCPPHAGIQHGEGCWLHCLGLAGELLQRVPNKAVRLPAANSALIGLPDLARRLISPAMQQGSASVRWAYVTHPWRTLAVLQAPLTSIPRTTLVYLHFLSVHIARLVPHRCTCFVTCHVTFCGNCGMPRGKTVSHPGCRAEAVRCLGLYSMLPDTQSATSAESPMEAVAASQRVAMLRTAFVFDPALAVQEAAAKALCDLALLRHAHMCYHQDVAAPPLLHVHVL